MARITRRRLLGASAAAALAATGGTLEGATSAATLRAPRLRKGMSLSGPAPLVFARHPNDARYHGNREYLRDVSGTRWVKLWVSWLDLQHAARPASRAQSWEQLSEHAAPTGGGPALRELDRQVRAVNDDSLSLRARGGSMGVILTVYQAYPGWATGARENEPARAGKPLEARLPQDLSPDGPWAWFVEHLLARYRRGVPPAPGGPRDDGGRIVPGNPDGAWIDAIEVVNEPNFLLWPAGDVVEATARMVETGAALSARNGGVPLLVPGTSDFPDPGRLAGAQALDWELFTRELLARLSRSRLEAPVAWSHHAYADVKYGGGRARRVLGLMDELGGWLRDRRLWITEAGYDVPDPADPVQRELQASLLERAWLEAAAEPRIAVFCQHGISDVAGNDFKSGLRDDFDWAAGVPGIPRPAWLRWAALPAARRA